MQCNTQEIYKCTGWSTVQSRVYLHVWLYNLRSSSYISAFHTRHSTVTVVQPVQCTLYSYKHILAWNPALHRVLIVTPAVYPHLDDFNRETNFSLWKSTNSTLNLKTKLTTFPWFTRGPQSKFEANQSRVSWVMIGQTNRQTEDTTLFI